MERILDPLRIEALKEKYPIANFFGSELCPYHYRIYEKGEFIQTPDSSGHNFHIVLSGSVQIYSISSAGQRLPISTVDSGRTVGEIELVGQYVPFYAQSTRETLCLVISISDCHNFLNEDTVFLRFLVNTLAEKLTFGSNIDYSVEDMDERVLFYLRSRDDRRIDHVEEATYGLRCSRSSLQRSLVNLCKAGKIEKIGKGSYLLIEQ